MTTAPETVCHLVWLDTGLAERKLVGGKGASLGRLAELCAPVPPALALTTEAYLEFARAIDLPQYAGDVSADDLAGIRAQIAAASLPSAVKAAIAQGFAAFQDRLGPDVALAVRSSATAEDAADFSFAGQHDTILGVRSLPTLEAAVRQCWASLWSERAIAYRRETDLVDGEVAIAVIVQQLIQSDVSFIAFTSDPVGGRERHLIISATWGLGEALVSGLVVPDHVVIGPGGDVVEYTVGDKHLMVIPDTGAGNGTEEVPVPRALRSMPSLSSVQAADIASLARELAPRLGFEADFEGAIAGEAIYFFQARPITTLSTRVQAGFATASAD
jgi:rifampicin phosphotransferase